MKYIKGFDVLRAIAVLLVIHHHWGSLSSSSPVLNFISQKIIPTGTFAVDLFFVLSGFLLTGILISSKVKFAQNSKWLIIRNFIARRSLRIFPIYYLLIIALYLINYQDVRQHIIYFATYSSNFMIFHNGNWVDDLSHLWTLAVEEQFYLIWPFCIVFIPDRFLVHLMLLFIIAGTAITVFTEYKYGFFGTILPYNCFNAFAIGGLYAYSLTGRKNSAVIQKTLFYLLPFAIICYVMIEAGVPHIPFRLVYAIITVNLIMYVQKGVYGKFGEAILNNRMLINLGKISYGVYLYHQLTQFFYYGLLHFSERKLHAGKHLLSILYQPYVAEAIQFILLIVFSYLSYVLIEMRILRLKKYFEYDDSAVINLV